MRLFSHKLPIVLFSFEIHHHIEPKEGRNIYKIQITNSSNFKGWSKLTICFRFYDYILNLWLPPELEIVWVWIPPWVREVSVSRPVVLFILHHYDLIIIFFPKKRKKKWKFWRRWWWNNWGSVRVQRVLCDRYYMRANCNSNKSMGWAPLYYNIYVSNNIN